MLRPSMSSLTIPSLGISGPLPLLEMSHLSLRRAVDARKDVDERFDTGEVSCEEQVFDNSLRVQRVGRASELPRQQVFHHLVVLDQFGIVGL